MYIFEATYENRDTFKQRTQKIEFDEHFFESEQECYIYAMKKSI